MNVQYSCLVNHRQATALNLSAKSYEITEASAPIKVTKLTDGENNAVLLYLPLNDSINELFKINVFSTPSNAFT